MLAAIASRVVPVVAAIAAETQMVSGKENNTRLFGLVIICNVIASGFTMTALGTRVAAARKKYNVELPQMYAAGYSPEATAFNNIQRGHQQALETYPAYLALSFVSGTRFPITTALGGILYCVSRLKWADLYADDAAKRYDSWLSKQVWTPLIAFSITSLVLGVELLLDVHKGIF